MDLLSLLEVLGLGVVWTALYCLVVAAVASALIGGAKRTRPAVTPPVRQPTSTPAPAEHRGRDWSQVPGWVSHDRAWAAAVVLLGAPDLAGRTAPFVDFAAREIDWLGLRLAATAWPRRERLMVDVAHDLAVESAPQLDDLYPGDPVTVTDLLTDLDQSHVALVYAAVDLHRGACSLAQAQSVADSLDGTRT
jgi:hypothetical protein